MHVWKRTWQRMDRVVLAADARWGPLAAERDGVWALHWAEDVGGPVLETTYGLQARRVRLFPLFFTTPERLSWVRTTEGVPAPRWQALAPNYAAYTWQPFPGVAVTVEWLVPASQVVLARLTLHNGGEQKVAVPLGLVAEWVTANGPGFELVERRAVHVLEGQVGDQAALVFLTGGPEGRFSPFPMLTLDADLVPGATRRLRLVHLLAAEVETGFEAARRWAARPWEALVARVALSEARSPLVLPEDAEVAWTLAVARQTAWRLLRGPAGDPSRYTAWRSREPDGADAGFSVAEGWYLTVGFLLPGAEEEAQALLEGALATQREDGWLGNDLGLVQEGQALASPLLVDWADRVVAARPERASTLQARWFDPLQRFLEHWFRPEQDVDGDGLPEWRHPAQLGVDALPGWGAWHPASDGADPAKMEDPALWALLYRACEVLADWAVALEREREAARWRERAEHLRRAVQAAWDPRRAHPLRRERDTHTRPPARRLGRRQGPGEVWLDYRAEPPTRLVITLHLPTPVQGQVLVRGLRADGRPWSETLSIAGRWFEGRVTLTTTAVYRQVEAVVVEGVPRATRVSVRTPDYTAVDLTLLLPLWAQMLTPEQAAQVVRRLRQARGGYAQPYGLPFVPGLAQRDPWWWAVHPFWNLLVVEGLLAYGEEELAAAILERVWRAATENVRRSGRFREAYHARTGEGLGRRDVLLGLPPITPALRLAGVVRVTPQEVVVSRRAPFSAPLRVLWYDLQVLCGGAEGEVRFQDGVVIPWQQVPVRVRYAVP